MDKKYNGFNNGRDKSDGVGGREVNHGTQQSMTKAFIVANVREITDLWDKEEISYSRMVEMLNEKAAEFYKQEVAKEREMANNLLGALNEYIVLLGEELDEVMGFVNAHQWKSTRFEQGKILREKIKQSLNEYEGIKPEITGNQTAC